jgi:uroporphyrinogen-III synthase
LAFLLEAPGGVPRVGRVLAVGARTLDLARQAGLPVDPEVHPGSGLALARCVPAAPPALRLLVPRGNVARDEAVEALKAAGHVVEAPVLYRTEPVEYAPEQVAALQGDPPEVVLFASPSAFRHFLAAFGREVLERAHIGVIGPTTRAEVEASGFTVKLMPARPELSELAAELRRFHDGDSGSPLP